MRFLAVLSLASGIGLASALAGLIDAILLRPLPVPRPQEIARVFTASPGEPFGFVSFPDFVDFRRIKPMVAECLVPVAVGDPPQMKLALAVTPDYFQILGVAAKFGRTFEPGDHMAAILAHGTAADLGTSRRIAGKLYTVIGVAPENFGLDRFLHADLYIPISSYGDGKILEDRGRRFLTVHVRGLNAASELAAIAARLEREYPATNRGRRAVVLDEMTSRLQTEQMMGRLAAILGVLAASILAMSIVTACGAALARNESRARDLALKIALGASPARLFGESLRDGGGVAFLGCTLGLPFAWVVEEVLRRTIVLPTDFAISIAARIDGRVLAVAVASAILATIASGVTTRARQTNIWTTLKTKGQTRNLLAAVQIALASALIATSLALWAGLKNARQTDLGYRTKNIAVLTFDPGQLGFSEIRTRAFYHDLLVRIRTLPGVRRVSLAQSVPLGMTGAQRRIQTGNDAETTAWMNIVTSDYFETMHMRIVAGRTFREDDRAVTIVNQELAKRVPIGKTMLVAGRPVEVIGIVKTARYMRWDEPPRPFFYLPYAQNYASRMTVHVEADTNVIGAVRRLAPDVPSSECRMLREYFDQGAMFGARIALQVTEIAGMGGLLLALAGLYGVVASSVARRRREIGIRLALGASHRSVFTMIVKEGMKAAFSGIPAGFALASYASTFLPVASLSWTSTAAAALMFLASFVCCSIPALRTLNTDPGVTLREIYMSPRSLTLGFDRRRGTSRTEPRAHRYPRRWPV